MVLCLGEEDYFCCNDDSTSIMDDYQNFRKTWKCTCCNLPVVIEATTEDDDIIRYYRLSAKDLEDGDFVHVPGAGFSEVLAVGKQANGYFVAIKEYRRLSRLDERKFFNTLYTGRF
ncbi:hypothetical protein ACEH99_004445 [Vibrio vulnificus]|uniref:hypothetical protein n=1 Tax=Vibrio vulnificus TaxID=672 RepID=UPI001E18322F|nr:hypothetical protein [Vibrio vulnificus]EID4421396.1 hypothetical protein [Vibrio vulnificus]EKD9069045.1 hypothetical protein [Vibrio vulnificus]EKO5176733.1 hypothetical protein [Vibrio vulnificus]EKO5196930.1 hypothetical protein [Vibrio vulnificus]ELV8614316.1 hypothetical protein [Vibrio vulnificus]